MADIRTPVIQSVQISPAREFRDVLGRMKVSIHQNRYDADFEYGRQDLRWESFTNGAGTITHLPGEGGVRMRLTNGATDASIRQSRPYHRYQPGKTMFMATAVWFGPATTNQRQRVGFFDDGNGVFIEQSDPTPQNPFGMAVVIRSETGSLGPIDTRFEINNWNGQPSVIKEIDWNRIQMLFIEYAWYGAGTIRWGVFLEGIPYTLHQYGQGNSSVGTIKAWSKTGNLPVRFEQRNVGAVIPTANDMVHYGVSVIVEGGVDDQRGFTYAYGLPFTSPRRSIAAAATRFPIMSYRGKLMGVNEWSDIAGGTAGTGGAITGTPTTTTMTVTNSNFTAGALVGRYIYWPTLNQVARITANTTNSVNYADNVLGGPIAVAPTAGIAYTIGIINRGQMLPRRLQLTSDQPVYVEIFMSKPGAPNALTGSSFAANPAATYSFAQIDSTATAITGGECVYSIFVAANSPVDQPIDNLFPLVNTLRGSQTDILTVAVTNPGATAANVSCQIIGQEAMS